MPAFTFTSPEGKTYDVTGPDGASAVQAFQMLQQHLGSSGGDLPAEPGYATSGALPSPNAQALKETITGPAEGGSQEDWFNTQQSIEKQLRAQGMTDEQIVENTEWQKAAHNLNRSVMSANTSTAMGAAGGDIAEAGAARVLAPVGKALAPAWDAVSHSRIAPGATTRATGALKKIAAPTGKLDPLGQDILAATTGGDYATLYDERASLLGRAAHIVDEDQRRKAFRDIYQSSLFKTLRDFEQSPLGKKLTATTGRYSEVIKADPAKIPHMVFDTPQSVRDFRMLLGGDQKKVEDYARQYAAESIHAVLPERSIEVNPFKSQSGRMAEAVNAWLKSPQQEWLNEVPQTKAAVENFAQGLTDTAKAQAKLRLGVFGLGTGALFEEGFHPWSWVKGLAGGM